jgi:hypothetical protein
VAGDRRTWHRHDGRRSVKHSVSIHCFRSNTSGPHGGSASNAARGGALTPVPLTCPSHLPPLSPLSSPGVADLRQDSPSSAPPRTGPHRIRRDWPVCDGGLGSSLPSGARCPKKRQRSFQGTTSDPEVEDSPASRPPSLDIQLEPHLSSSKPHLRPPLRTSDTPRTELTTPRT